ncbi:MAG: DUF1289 domain-containing protein [Steroidobacteraceae bacterium]|nr:DUF1289 domain-containing protein [Steroidobacteraceae bacterium]
MDDTRPFSPCINVCSLDSQEVCRGCYRTLAEIAGWGAMSAGEQRAVVERAEGRRLAAYQERTHR